MQFIWLWADAPIRRYSEITSDYVPHINHETPSRMDCIAHNAKGPEKERRDKLSELSYSKREPTKKMTEAKSVLRGESDSNSE